MSDLQRSPWFLRFRWMLPLALLPLAIVAAGQHHHVDVRHLDRLADEGWEVVCLAISCAGLAMRLAVGGFAEGGPTNRASGAPAPASHPTMQYLPGLATYLSLLGVALLPGAIWFVATTSAAFLFWYGPLARRGRRAQWSGPARRRQAAAPSFPPLTFHRWLPAGRFSLRRALHQEQNYIFFVIASFVGLELACDLLGEELSLRQWLSEDLHWALLFAGSTLLYAYLARRDRAAVGAMPLAGPETRGLRVDSRVEAVDTLENLISFGQLQRILTATLAAAELSPGDRLLDVGCGSGKLAIQAAALGDDKSIAALGIDATPGMIERALENAHRSGSSAAFQVGVGEALPAAAASFDAVTSSYFLHHIPSDMKRLVLREMWRVLAPGGRLVIADYGRPTGLAGQLAAFPMRFNFHEHVRGQLAGELETILAEEAFGPVEHLRSFLGYINVMRVVKPAPRPAT